MMNMDDMMMENPISMVYVIFVFWLIGVGSVVNLVIGFKALAFKTKEKKNCLLHKSSMAFAMYWILHSAFCDVLMTIVQLSIGDCGLGQFGAQICNTVGFTIQWLILIASLYYYDRNLLQFSSVKWNLRSLGFFIFMLYVVST